MFKIKLTTCLLVLLTAVCSPVYASAECAQGGEVALWWQVVEQTSDTAITTSQPWLDLADSPACLAEAGDQYDILVFRDDDLLTKAPDKYASPRKRDGPAV